MIPSVHSTNPMSTVPNPALFRRLYAAIIASEEATAAEKATRAEVLAFMEAEHPSTVKCEWGQVQFVTSDTIAYRDGAVTAAKAAVTKLETQLKEAKAVLKGAQDAAKAAGGARARITKTAHSIRVMRGNDN
jgi:hypothetical protein